MGGDEGEGGEGEVLGKEGRPDLVGLWRQGGRGEC